MIKPLRKRHLQIWILMAILLPLGIIGATVARRHIPSSALIRIQSDTSDYPRILIQKETSQFAIQLRGKISSDATQLLWINKLPLSTPTAAIYMASTDKASLSDALYLGRIESRGNYFFNLPQQQLPAQTQFIVYDFIHKQIIERIYLTTK